MPRREFNLTDLDGVNGFAINGATAGDESGSSIASAGDINGDGIEDIVIGAYSADPNGQTNAGENYVLFGHRGAWSSQLSLSSLNGSNGLVLPGVDAGDRSGVSVSSAGDVNGDGIADVIIGAYYASPNGQVQAGKSYVVFGHQGSWPASLPLSSLNGSNGLVFQGINANDWSGRSVSAAGDINGDGIDDVIIGAYAADPNNRASAGESYVVFGHRGIWPAQLPLSSLNGSNGLVLQGVGANDESGGSVSSAGDINGDGIADVMIDARNGHAGTGESYVVFGHQGPWPSLLPLSSLNGTNGFVLQGIAAGDWCGFSVASAGDINGDGIADVIVGAPWADPNSQAQAGESYIVFGHQGAWPAQLPLSSLNGSNGLVLQGIDPGDWSGYAVSAVGDINGDGIDDVIIGATYAAPHGRAQAGESYVVFGRRGAWPAQLLLSSLNGSNGLVLTGIGAGGLSGSAVSSAGDINGDGFNDVMIGASNESPGNRVSAGQNYVIFGGAEQFSANQIEVQQGETLILSQMNIEVDPNINSRIISVSNVRHGHFALASSSVVPINTFTQSQINNRQIVFVHDDSNQAPNYTLSAQGITRVFGDVRPQIVNVSFITVSPTVAPTSSPTAFPSAAPIATPTDVPTNTPTALPSNAPITASADVPTGSPTTFPSNAPTLAPTDLLTSAPIVPPADAPTVTPTVNPSSFFASPSSAPTQQLNIFTSSPTTEIDTGGEIVTNEGGGSSLPLVAIVGGVVGGVALLVAGLFYYKRRQHLERKSMAQEISGNHHRTEGMTVNPAYVSRVGEVSTAAATTTAGRRVSLDSYLYVAGSSTTTNPDYYEMPVIPGRVSADYEEPVSTSITAAVLDDDNYVMRAGDHSVPQGHYALFRSSGNQDVSEMRGRTGTQTNESYSIFGSGK